MNRHFRSERDDRDIAWLYFDVADSAVNVLSAEVLEAFDRALIGVAQTHPHGLVIASAKPSGFIAGADVRELARVRDPQQARRHIERAHEILHRLEALAFPSLALIRGHCLGGGLELALACRYRVACDEPGTRLGFPEVRLGLFPGFGGTVRSLPRIGHLSALQMMLTGRSVGARAAQRMGLVDLAVPERQLRNGASRLLTELPASPRPAPAQRVAGLAPVRPLVAAYLRHQVGRRASREQLPAPWALIDHWRVHAGRPNEMYRGEARQVAELISGDAARNLIRVFLLQERLKSEGAKEAFQPRRVHVVGGGVMGGDIAAWCALRGLEVTLQDRAPRHLGPALARARELFEGKLRDPYRVRAAMDRLQPDHRGLGIARAEVIIEAVFEDLGVKQALYAELEPRMRSDALLATNTSSIPLQRLGEGLARPGRIIGLHFFNPVAKMQLLEVVGHAASEPDMLLRARSFARHIDKLPLPVRSAPGFLVNRVLLPYLLEAVQLLDEGVPAPVVDRAAVRFGMPIGPIELADTVGLDVCLAVAERMAETLHNPVPERLRQLVSAGHLGRKSGRGFFAWRNQRPIKPRVRAGYSAPEDLTDRLVLRLVNESMACLRQGVVADEDLLDAGVVFGTGFAPFRGGPLRYAHQKGDREVRERLRQLERAHGSQFRADSGWPCAA
jgi:3-hydroxyacyl-CoA dehydrogenase/enoyl-CoA hydratase/3-hydroxybutyryl-CoA epimerase